jgi:hypothetical protein
MASGGAKDGDTGLVEGAFSANVRTELVEQLSNEHAVLALRVIGDLARRIRRDDERVVGRVDWRKPVGVGAETAFIGIASRGVEDGQRGASAPLLNDVRSR